MGQTPKQRLGPPLKGGDLRAWRDNTGKSAEVLSADIGRWLRGRDTSRTACSEPELRWRSYGLKKPEFSTSLIYKVEKTGYVGRSYARALVDYMTDRHGLPESFLLVLPTVLSNVDRDELLSASLRLDRSVQWLAVTEACAGKRSAYLLLHGSYRQALSLFLRRVDHVLGAHLNTVQLDYASQDIVPTSGIEWEYNLGRALDRKRLIVAEGRPLLDRLVERPLLILLEIPWNVHFAEEQVEGLRSFLVETLPRLVLAAGSSSFGVRLLVATDFVDPVQSHTPILTRMMREAHTKAGMDFRAIPEVTLPTIVEVEEYLRSGGHAPEERIYQEIVADYQRILAGVDALSFRDMCHDIFDRRLMN